MPIWITVYKPEIGRRWTIKATSYPDWYACGWRLLKLGDASAASDVTTTLGSEQ